MSSLRKGDSGAFISWGLAAEEWAPVIRYYMTFSSYYCLLWEDLSPEMYRNIKIYGYIDIIFHVEQWFFIVLLTMCFHVIKLFHWSNDLHLADLNLLDFIGSYPKTVMRESRVCLDHGCRKYFIYSGLFLWEYYWKKTWVPIYLNINICKKNRKKTPFH